MTLMGPSPDPFLQRLSYSKSLHPCYARPVCLIHAVCDTCSISKKQCNTARSMLGIVAKLSGRNVNISAASRACVIHNVQHLFILFSPHFTGASSCISAPLFDVSRCCPISVPSFTSRTSCNQILFQITEAISDSWTVVNLCRMLCSWYWVSAQLHHP